MKLLTILFTVLLMALSSGYGIAQEAGELLNVENNFEDSINTMPAEDADAVSEEIVESPESVEPAEVSSKESPVVPKSVIPAPAPKIELPIAKPHKVSKNPMTQHSISDIRYKISRAQENLKSHEGNLGENRTRAIEYLQKALDELKAY